MTQPAPPPQQQPTQAQIAALAALLATTAPPAGVAAGFAALVRLPGPVARRVLDQVPAKVPTLVAGPAARRIATAEYAYRAAYLLNAASRVRASMAAGKTLDEALAAEQRYAVAHVHAQANRAAAADAADRTAARQRSTILGWKAVMDSRTSADCAANNGKNFDLLTPPMVGYPGSVHPHCRCRAVAAFAGAPMVGSGTAGKAEAA